MRSLESMAALCLFLAVGPEPVATTSAQASVAVFKVNSRLLFVLETAFPPKIHMTSLESIVAEWKYRRGGEPVTETWVQLCATVSKRHTSSDLLPPPFTIPP